MLSYPKQFYRHSLFKAVSSPHHSQSIFIGISHQKVFFLGMLSYPKLFYRYVIVSKAVLLARRIQSSFIDIAYPKQFQCHIVSKVVYRHIVSKVVLPVCYRIQSSFIGIAYSKQFHHHIISKAFLSVYRIKSSFFGVCYRIQSCFIGMVSYPKQFYWHVVSKVVLSAQRIQSSFICRSYPKQFYRYVSVSKVGFLECYRYQSSISLPKWHIGSKVVLMAYIQSSFIGISYPKQFYHHIVSKKNNNKQTMVYKTLLRKLKIQQH